MNPAIKKNSGNYSLRGVDVAKADVHHAVKGLGKGIFPNAFCKILPDYFTGDNEKCIVIHADGAGTKSSLAYIYWKETGDISVWKGIAQDALVMNIDDLLCVGAADNIVVSTTIGRNKHLIPGEVISAIIGGVEEFTEQMKGLGINIIPGGGETADTGDTVRNIVVDATAACMLKRNEVIENKIQPGDAIVGFASSGKASYENEYNSGIGSNGLTLARHALFHNSYAAKYPESFDSLIPENLIYCGKYNVTDKDSGKLALSPTRTYAPVMKVIFQAYRKQIHGIIHCTGGGQAKALNFIDKLHIIKDNLFEPPDIFKMIMEESGTAAEEMYRVFNMGHRMEIYVPPAIAAPICELAARYHIEAKIIGRAEASGKRKITVNSKNGIFVYS